MPLVSSWVMERVSAAAAWTQAGPFPSVWTAAWRASQLRNKILVSFCFFKLLGHLSLVPALDLFAVWLWPAERGQEKRPRGCETTACAALARQGSTSLPPLRAGSCPPSSPAQQSLGQNTLPQTDHFIGTPLKGLGTKEHQPRGRWCCLSCFLSHLLSAAEQQGLCKCIAVRT